MMTSSENCDINVKTLMKEIENSRRAIYYKGLPVSEYNSINSRCEELCLKEKAIAEKNGNSELLAHAMCYLEECYFAKGKVSSLIDMHYETVRLLKENNLYRLLATTLEHFANISSVQGSLSLAVENAVEASELCLKHGLMATLSHIYEITGDMYARLGAYKKAESLYDLSLKNLDLCTADLADQEGSLISDGAFRARILSSKANCLINQNKPSDAYSLILAARKFEEKSTYSIASLNLQFVTLTYLQRTRDPAFRPALESFTKTILSSRVSYHLIDYMPELCAILMAIDEYDEMIHLIEYCETTLAKDIISSAMLPVMPFKLMYYQKNGLTNEYDSALFDYYKYIQTRDSTLRLLNQYAVKYRIRMNLLSNNSKRIKESIDALTIESETDSLTGLYNYSKMQDILELKIEYCYEKKLNLGLSIIDVDYFKQFNDRYGHQNGDSALKAVAAAMNSFSSEKIFCGRYGGDEFIMLFVDMSDSEILSVCEKLRTAVRSCGITHYATSSGTLSVSQGVRNSIPEPRNRSWDYLYAADQSLYDVKEICRGNIEMVSAYFELTTDKLIKRGGLRCSKKSFTTPKKPVKSSND